ncbi:hypothetical protein Tco_1400995 [Tanacetum coccineum]
MDSIIPLGQKNTLAEYMILSGADNRPPMLDKDLYDSWKSKMELYMQNRENGRMILESVENDPLIWLMIEENGSCQGVMGKSLTTNASLPPDWNKFVTDVKLIKALHTTNYDQLHAYLEQHELHANEVCIMHERNQDPLALINSGQVVHVFKQGDDPIDAINKIMSFLSTIVTSRFPSTNNQLRNSSNPRQQATVHDGRLIIQPFQGRQNSFAADTSGTRANI